MISASFSQVPPYTIWNKRYNSPSNLSDSAVGVAVDGNGNVFVTGWSSSNSTGRDIVTMRYNPVAGDSIWVKRFVGPQDEIPSVITVDNNFVYITGWTFEPSRDILTIKYNSTTGDTVWVGRYNGTGNGGDYGLAICLDASSNVYVTGRSDIGGSQKFTTLKYNAAGAQQWACVYSWGLSSTFDEAHGITVDQTGNVYVTGYTRTNNIGDYLTLKINSNGDVLWAKKYNGPSNGDDGAVGLVLDAAGANVYITGYSQGTSSGYDFFTIKYNASTGDSLASARYNGTGNAIDYPVGIAKDESDNIYVCGLSYGANAHVNYATVKYNSSLVQQWVSRYVGNSGDDYPSALAYKSGYVYVTGASLGAGQGYDFLTVRYNAVTGAEIWNKRDNGEAGGNDYASGIAVFDSTSVYVTGSSAWGSPTGTDYLTFRYSQNPVGIKRISENVPAGFKLMQNYPNPFNPETYIKFEVPKASFIKVFVYDILGREIATLVNQKLEPGSYQVNWNAADQTSGIYFYRLVSETYSDTKKMILVK